MSYNLIGQQFKVPCTKKIVFISTLLIQKDYSDGNAKIFIRDLRRPVTTTSREIFQLFVFFTGSRFIPNIWIFPNIRPNTDK